jgi:hypothetical protein
MSHKQQLPLWLHILYLNYFTCKDLDKVKQNASLWLLIDEWQGDKRLANANRRVVRIISKYKKV